VEGCHDPRWYGEGLPAEQTTDAAISAYFGLDDWAADMIRAIGDTAPKPAYHGAPLVRSREDYEQLQPHLWPEPAANLADLRRWAADQAAGGAWCG